MGLPTSRFMLFHRLVLLPPLVLLTLTCLYTSSTFSPFSTKHHLSFSQDMQCFSCESSSFPSRSFLSLANFPASSYIRDVVLRHNVLNVEDSRGETTTEPASRRDTNEAESVVDSQKSNENSDDPHPDSAWREKEEETSARIVVPKQTSAEENPVQQAKAEEELREREEQPTNTAPWDKKYSEDSKVDGSFHGDNASPTEEKIDNSVPSLKNVDSSSQIVEFSSETKENFEGSGKEDVSGSGPEDKNVVSSVKIAELSSETKENYEGDRTEDLQLENRHLTSEDHSGPDEHSDTPIETNLSVTLALPAAPPPPRLEEDILKFGYGNISREAKIAGIAVQKLMVTIRKSGLPMESVNSTEDVDVNLLLRGGSPQGVPLPEQRSCEGRRVFVYDLPSKFNVDLVGQCDTLLRWFNFCDYFMNNGMGTNVPTDELNDRGEKVLVPDGSWFLTHQYALELIFHARLKHYPCLTTDVNKAELFFVPYYAGLDVIRWHFQPNVSHIQRDQLTFELLTWLEGQETWSRNNGIDHVFVLGKIGWDFRRTSDTGRWGSKLLRLPAMWKPTKVLIERDPWHNHDVGVPHPTFFHPKDDNEIRTWLAHVEQSERRYLVSFAGMPRPKMLGNVRGHLIQQCLDHQDDCFLLRCVKTICMRPDSTMNLFLHSHFCMQPPGDSPTRRSVFDSLVGGCIPVLFDPYTAYYQYPWHLPQNASTYSVFIPSHDVMSGKSDIVEILKRISPEERTAMRMRIIREIIPGLLYSQPGTRHSDFRDAFDISIDALLHRVANLRAEKKFM